MSSSSFLGKLNSKNNSDPNTYLALVLSDHRVQAAVWKVVATKTEIVSLGTPVEWDGEVATTTELISVVDATISSATEGLEDEPDEVILGLANNWVNTTGILSSKKDLIKSICKELSLKPIGYVVLSDTLVKYLKMQEGTPPTSILIQLSPRTRTLSLVELGHIKHTVIVNASQDILSDVNEGLAQFPPDDPLPSRFILVSAMENASDIIQTLTAHDWLTAFKFLHTPKIEALPKDVEVHATAVAGGTELAKALGFSLETAPPVEKPQPTPPHYEKGEDYGFVAAAPEELTLESPQSPEDQPGQDQDSDFESATPTPPKTIAKSAFKLPSFRLPSIPLPQLNFSFNRSSSLYIALALATLIIALSLAYYFIPQATITLNVQAKPVTESLSLTLSPTATQIDVDNKIIPATYSTHSVSGKASVPTTGTKTIGDPAHGEVTIYNRTSLPKTFLKGTTLTANSLKFTLDDEVVVASKSAGSDYVDVPGKASVKITAANIGSSSNLSSETEFVVANFAKDNYVAKNENALTGGTSQEVTVVAETDKSALVKSLTTSLSSELKDSLALDTTATDNYYVLDQDIKIIKENYSHKVADVTDTLSGEVTLELGVLRYNQADVQSLIQNAVQQNTIEGYSPAQISPQIILKDTQVQDEDQEVIATAEVTLYLTPSLDLTSLEAALKGKNYSQATSFLATLPAVVSSHIKLTPQLPPRLLRLPFRSDRITVLVNSIK